LMPTNSTSSPFAMTSGTVRPYAAASSSRDGLRLPAGASPTRIGAAPCGVLAHEKSSVQFSQAKVEPLTFFE
jgi:hypothetical protein